MLAILDKSDPKHPRLVNSLKQLRLNDQYNDESERATTRETKSSAKEDDYLENGHPGSDNTAVVKASSNEGKGTEAGDPGEVVDCDSQGSRRDNSDPMIVKNINLVKAMTETNDTQDDGDRNSQHGNHDGGATIRANADGSSEGCENTVSIPAESQTPRTPELP